MRLTDEELERCQATAERIEHNLSPGEISDTANFLRAVIAANVIARRDRWTSEAEYEG